MRTITPGVIVLALLIGVTTISTGDEARPAADDDSQTTQHVKNDINQHLFVARLIAIETTMHRRFKWAMTFERITDRERFHYEVWDNDPVPAALGFAEWKHGNEDVAERIAAAPQVVLFVVFVKNPRRVRDPDKPQPVVQGCFVIDESVPNHRLQLTGDARE